MFTYFDGNNVLREHPFNLKVGVDLLFFGGTNFLEKHALSVTWADQIF